MTTKKDEMFIKKLKLAMLESGFNQVSLAKKLGIKSASVSQWLTGKNNPKISTLEKLAKATGKPVNYFFDSSTQVSGNSNVVGKNINISADVKKDIALLMAKMAAVESKIETLELKYNLLKKGK